MLDWDALIPADVVAVADAVPGLTHAENERVPLHHWDSTFSDSMGQVRGESVPPVPVEKASVPPRLGQAAPSNGEACSDFLASVPVVPVKKQGTGNEAEKIAGAAAVPQAFRAKVREKGNSSNQGFPAHPAAVLLLMAWSKSKQASPDERAQLLLDLEGMAPADQVRHWHGVCLEAGLKPWLVLCLPAPQSGDDCTRCKHLTTQEAAIGEERRRFHWACQLGYLILEHGRGTERIFVAPPECRSFERWYPSEWR